ncbi:MAG: hypothetical protein ABL901_20580 [Hyphomicrobiaceae bacterium]
MRRVVSVIVPLMILAVVTNHNLVRQPIKSYDLIAYSCETCDRQLLNKSVAFEDCQKAAYAMNDGSDVFLSIHPRNTRKFECRPAQ